MAGVNVVLGGGGQGVVALVKPGKEAFGVGELLTGVPPRGAGERAGVGSRGQPRDLMPAAESGQQWVVLAAGQLGEPVVQPGLESAAAACPRGGGLRSW